MHFHFCHDILFGRIGLAMRPHLDILWEIKVPHMKLLLPIKLAPLTTLGLEISQVNFSQNARNIYP